MGLSYSALAPIITPFVALYFGFGYFVWMYQTISIYILINSCGGMKWPITFRDWSKSIGGGGGGGPEHLEMWLIKNT